MTARDDYHGVPRQTSMTMGFDRWQMMCDEIDTLRTQLDEAESRCERMFIKANEAQIDIANPERRRAERVGSWVIANLNETCCCWASEALAAGAPSQDPSTTDD